MRDDLGERLHEEAGRFAATATPRPAHLVRARGDQRRRRAAALSAAVTATVLAVSGGGVYAAGHLGSARKVEPLNDSTLTPHPPRPGNPEAVILRQGNSLTCVSATDCWVVGIDQSVNGTLRPLIGHWNGSGWSMKAAPVPPHARITTLTAVSCLGARDCWAVGADTRHPRPPLPALHWDGTSWSLSVFAAPPGANTMVLGRVTCTSVADCWTVGYAGYGATKRSRRYAPLIEHWNGTRWSVVPSPGVGRLSGLRSMSCATSVDCWAIGTWIRAHGAGGGTLTEHWNGSAWSRIPTPTDNSGSPTWAPDDLVPSLVDFGATMLDVSCVSSGACMAVGNGRYDGVPSLNSHGVENLGGSRALTERRLGAAWTEVSTPSLAGANVTGLVGVSCTSGSWCMAVGFSAPHDGPPRSLAEQWNGSAWKIVAVPNPPGRSGNELMGVSCVTSADCWAWGSNVDGSRWFTAHWNGARWSMAR